ncbi:glycerol-3-phosphate 1-O-acyltransferase PlsY [Thalassoglobus sp.]|uniref:glycerol-3-phosphate 1-O-acyltransferase PlsY n=1 Tax=Thalassoglobus sp. TaxID=2795869 RepID=UPI003AA8DAD7
MSPGVAFTLTAAIAYLIGSIPFSLLIAKFVRGIDLREQGSGNVGATNVARTMGAKWGAVALLCDATKGMLSVGLIPLLLPVDETLIIHQQVLGAIFAVLGHMFSIWLGMRGGKGVATALGAVVILSPWTTLIAFIAFVIVFVPTKLVSLASMLAAVTYAVTQLVRYQSELFSERLWSLAVFSIGVPCLIIFQHRANVVRLLKGTESKLTLGKKKTDPAPQDETSK